MIKKRFVLLSVLGLLLFSCKQSPIFFDISLEVEPIDPRVAGSPTNIVQIGTSLYAASRFSGTIYQYQGSKWTTLSQSPGSIIEIAATDDTLYALTGSPGSPSLQKCITGASPTWTQVDTGGKNVQSIYGAGDYLFAGVVDDASTNPPTCSIFYVNDNESKLKALASEDGLRKGLLKGAIYDGKTYYLAINGSTTTSNDKTYNAAGILFTADPSSSSPPQQINVSSYNKIMGIIQVGDKIVAVSRDGYILYGSGADFTAVNADVSRFTGALATWTDDEGNNLLLLGIQGVSSYSTTHGYREILLKKDGTLDTSALSLRSPGEKEPSSVKDYDEKRNGYEQYVVTIGKHPLSSIIQAEDDILFATTSIDGLWSYRERGGKPVWNAED